MLSVNSCRIDPRTLAPSATRIANSRSRAVGAREQQTREIDRGDEQHEADGAEQHEQSVADLADDRSRSGATSAAPMRLVLRILLGERRA